jgi:hypothetical protein
MIIVMLRRLGKILFVATLVGCASAPTSTTTSPSPSSPPEDVVSVAAAVELARSAFTAGCVRTYNERAEKGYFAQCRAAADSYVESEVVGIIRGKR